MPTIYVSNSTANGYAVGNDSNTYAQMQSKSTPALTLTGAVAKAVAGDTIIINDGTYLEAGYVAPSRTNLTINAQNDYQAIIQTVAAVTSRVIHQLASADGLTLGKIVVDGQNVQNWCVSQDSSNNVNSFTLSGTKMINFLQVGLFSQKAINITLKNGWSISGSPNSGVNVYGIQLTAAAVGTISIQDGTMNIQSGANVTSRVNAMEITTAVTGTNLIVKRTAITISASLPQISIRAIYASGFTTYDIGANTITETSVQNVSGSYEGIHIPNAATGCTKCWVYNNTINGGNPSPATNASGHDICIGDDANTAPTNSNTLNGVWIYGNTCTNMNHVIFVGWVTGAVVQGNLATNGVIGVIGKHTTNCIFTGNIVKDVSTGGSLRAKASTNDMFSNNTVILTANSTSTGIGILVTDVSSGITFNNNIVYMSGVSAICVQVLDTSTATFNTNDYYTVVGFAVNPFQYQATNYADLSTWQTAHETGALNVEPGFISYPTDLRIPAGGALYHRGTYSGAQNADYRLSPFYVTPTLGAYEVGSRDPVINRIPARIGA